MAMSIARPVCVIMFAFAERGLPSVRRGMFAKTVLRALIDRARVLADRYTCECCHRIGTLCDGYHLH